MSNSLPVPSKGALRALRHLALGTSCTVAVSAGLLTEDRRRRIHTAQAVQQNGQRIKGSKSYHETAAAVAIAALEEHVLSPEYFTSTDERHVLPPPGTWKSQPIRIHFGHEGPTVPPRDSPAPLLSRPTGTIPRPLLAPSAAAQHSTSTPYYYSSAKDIAREAESLISDGNNAGARAIDLILQYLRKSGVSATKEPALMEVCKKLYIWSTGNKGGLEAYAGLLQVVLGSGPVSEELYHDLHTPQVVQQILKQRARQLDTNKDRESLKTAASLFSTPFQASKQSTRRDRMISLATHLSTALYEAQMWKETVQVCERIREIPTAKSYRCTAHLILAQHELGNNKEVLRRFESDFVSCEPSKKYFGLVVAAALDAAMKHRRVDAAEQVVIASAEMARDQRAHARKKLNIAYAEISQVQNKMAAMDIGVYGPKTEKEMAGSAKAEEQMARAERHLESAQAEGLKTKAEFRARAEWFNKVLGKQWRYSKDLAKTRALLERLEAFFDVVDLPESCYSAMLQFSVESGDEGLADLYLNKVISGKRNYPLVQIRTLGHLILASAINGDWDAVKNGVQEMLSHAKDVEMQDIVSRVFAPIFKLYASAHSPQESEAFLGECLSAGLPLHPYTSNIMVDQFAAAKDMDSVTRWVEELPQFGLAADCATFNTLLTHLCDDWGMPYDDLFECVREMKERAPSMVNHITFNILRDALIRDSKGRRLVFVRSLQRLESLGLISNADHDAKNDVHKMRQVVASGSNVKALKHYEHAIADENAHTSPAMLGLAVKACLGVNSSQCENAAIQMLADAKKRGVDIDQGLTRLILARLDKADGTLPIYEMVGKTEEILAEHGLEPSSHLILHITSIMCDRGAFEAAHDFWMYHYKHGHIKAADIDISCFTLCLRMHIGLRKASGLEWIAKNMAQKNVIPDQRFMAQLKDQKRRLKGSISGRGVAASVRDRQFYDVVAGFAENMKGRRKGGLAKCRTAAGRLLDIMGEAAKESKGADEVGDLDGSAELASALGRPQGPPKKSRFDSGKDSARFARTDREVGDELEEDPFALQMHDDVRWESAADERRPQFSIITREKMAQEQIEAQISEERAKR